MVVKNNLRYVVDKEGAADLFERILNAVRRTRARREQREDRRTAMVGLHVGWRDGELSASQLAQLMETGTRESALLDKLTGAVSGTRRA